jgi:methylated-DNA-[protein]-cysteine S-methyltransferase
MPKKLNSADVYEMLLRIPEGRISTYGDIARALGNPGASRAIGKILNKNPNPVTVPCHRVVMSDGKIGGYAFGKDRKKRLLGKEGLSFDEDAMQDFAKRRLSARELSESLLPLPGREGVQVTSPVLR